MTALDVAAIALCDVQVITADAECGDLPAFAYVAQCVWGHTVEGHACEACMAAKYLGCNACAELGRGYVRVVFEPGECHCGCGNDTTLSVRTDRRYGRVRGRPNRYIQSHNQFNPGRYRPGCAQAPPAITNGR